MTFLFVWQAARAASILFVAGTVLILTDELVVFPVQCWLNERRAR